MRKTNFTFNKRGRLRNKLSSKLQFAIFTALFFTLMGMATSLEAQCNLVCDDDVQISLGLSGEHTIEVADVLQNATPGCVGLFVIAYDENNDPIPGNLVDCSFHGRTVSVGVYDDQGNNCWSNALIMDKMAPLIECNNDTITCGEAINYPLPVLTDNCSGPADITVTVLDQYPVAIDCDSFFTGMIIRRLTATDGNGNSTPDSLVCNDTLYVERIDFSSLVEPTNQTNHNGSNPSADDALLCDESNWTDLNNNGIPEPGEPGVNVPTLNGQPFLPGLIEECNVDIGYEDDITTSNCKTKIFRTYTVREWHCDSVIKIEFLHMITIVDDSGPDVTAPAPFTKTTNGVSCEVDVVIPAATVTDDCNTIKTYQVITPFGNEIRNSVQPVTVTLPAGTHTIIIRAFDACNNPGSDEFEVTVEDNTNPIPVCDQHTVVSLTNNGTARIYATTFDDGSTDDCGIDYIEVKRMGPDCDGTPSVWRDYVDFCCADIAANPIMVQFRVVDNSGNSNTCMVEVEVQDKLPIQYQCLPTLTISCEMDRNDLSVFGTIHVINNLNDLNDPALDPREDIEFDDPGDLIKGSKVVGIDGYVHDNCFVTVTELAPVENVNSCGVGSLVRRFEFRDVAGSVVGTCSQLIRIQNFRPFDDNVRFPEDVVLTNNGMCNPTDLTPQWLSDNVGARFGFPVKFEDRCDMLSTSHTDMVFYNSRPDSTGCFKIMRTWKAMDWCEQGGAIITDVQIIEVINTIAPTILSTCADVTLFSSNDDCNSRFVDLMLDAEDDCTAKSELDYEWTVFLDGDKIDPANRIDGNTNNASGNYPIGSHLIEWSVEDRCGNISECSFEFTIDNRKAASPVAYNGLSAELMPIDTDGDGVFDAGMLELTPDYFNRGSFHACGIDFTLSFSSDPNDTILSLNCDDVGQVEVELWAHAANGAKSYVRTYLLVQANADQCGPGNNGPTYPVGGLVSGLTSSGISSVKIVLDGTNAETMTSATGTYNFSPMPEGGNYTVMPVLNKDVLNGVTTWDLALIQRHILGLAEINDPYLLIAADINKDNVISGKDLTVLRRVILGIDEDFRTNKSWRFVDAAYAFNSSDPLSENFPESYDIRNLNSDMSTINFIGTKIGDINKSATMSGAQGRTATSVALEIADARFNAGDIVRIPVTSGMIDNMDAMQFTLKYDVSSLTFSKVEAGLLNINNENIALIEDGTMTSSWNATSTMKFEKGETLFTLVFDAQKEGVISNEITMNSEVTEALAYVNGEENNLNIEFRSLGDASAYALYQNVPNPVATSTVIGFNLVEATEATLTIYNLTGAVVKEVKADYAQGYNEVTIDVSELGAEGVLYYRLDAGEFTASKKMIVLK